MNVEGFITIKRIFVAISFINIPLHSAYCSMCFPLFTTVSSGTGDE